MAADIEFHLQLARISRNDNVLHIMSELGDQLIRTSVLSVRYGDFSLTPTAVIIAGCWSA